MHACSNTRKTSDIQEVESYSMQRASNACLHLASKAGPRCVGQSCVGGYGLCTPFACRSACLSL